MKFQPDTVVIPSVADPLIDCATTPFDAQFPEAIGSLCMIVGPMHSRGSGTEDKWPERKWLGRKWLGRLHAKPKTGSSIFSPKFV